MKEGIFYRKCIKTTSKVTSKNVIPACLRLPAGRQGRQAKAGIHKLLTILDSRWSLPRT